MILKLGHRGAKGHIAENTIASIEKALSFKVHGFEIDVHKCATGEIVVFHDFTLDRLTNGGGEIALYSFLELSKLKVSNLYHIPRLQEVLNLVSEKTTINIELKGRDTAIETAKIIEQFIAEGKLSYEQVIVSSFQKTELKIINDYNSKLQLGVLTQASVTEALSFAQQINAYAIHPNYTLLSPSIVTKAQNLGFKVNTWTVNDPQDIKRMKRYKVNGIISDFPERL